MSERLGATRVLVLRYHLEALLGAPRSVTGAQLEQLRQGGLPQQQTGAHPDGGARLRIQYMDLLALCRDLDATEEQVARMRYGPTCSASGHETGLRAGMRRSDSAVLEEEYLRNVPAAEVQRVHLGLERGAPPAMLTAEGEELVTASPGELAPGRLLVRGRRVRWPNYHEIALALDGMTMWQVQRHLKRAASKVDAQLRSLTRQDIDDILGRDPADHLTAA